jgi:predicted secreted protein
MRWIACLTCVVTIFCVGTLAVAPFRPASAHAPWPSAEAYAPAAATEPMTLTAVSAMTLTVTAADNGGTVQVSAGGDLLVELSGNPSTGYGWQVSANDNSILLPIAEWFEPDTNLVGSPGLEKFSFHVMAPGDASLRLIYGRPWETDPPPTQTFAVTVEAIDQAAPTAPVTVGSADAGRTIALLPGQLMNVALEGDSAGTWYFTDGDPMIVQQLGEWVVTPLDGDPAHSLFTRTFIGVQPGTANLSFGFSASGEEMLDPIFAVTVVVPPVQPGNSTSLYQHDSGKAIALAAGDTLVVRLRAALGFRPWYQWIVTANDVALLPEAFSRDCILYGEWRTKPSYNCTSRFLAQAAGQLTLRLGYFRGGGPALPPACSPPCMVELASVVYYVTIVDPAGLTGNTVPVTQTHAGSAIHLAPGDRLDVALDPSADATWLVMTHDPSVLSVLPSESPPSIAASTTLGVEHFLFQAVTAGQSGLTIGLFPTGIPTPVQIFTATIAVDWPHHQYLPKVAEQ